MDELDYLELLALLITDEEIEERLARLLARVAAGADPSLPGLHDL